MESVKIEMISVLKRILNANIGIEPYVFVTFVKSKNEKVVVPKGREYLSLTSAFGYKNDKFIQYLGNFRVCPIIEEGVWFEKCYYGGEALQNNISKRYRESWALKERETVEDENGDVYRSDSGVSVVVVDGKNAPDYPGINTVLVNLKRAKEVIGELESEIPMFDLRNNFFTYKGKKVRIPKGYCTRALNILMNNLGEIVSKKDFYCAVYEYPASDYTANLKKLLTFNELAEDVFKDLKTTLRKARMFEIGLVMRQNEGFILGIE